MVLKFLLCYAPILQGEAHYAYCFTRIILLIYSIVQVSTHHNIQFVKTLALYDSFTRHFYAQERRARLDRSLNVAEILQLII